MDPEFRDHTSVARRTSFAQISPCCDALWRSARAHRVDQKLSALGTKYTARVRIAKSKPKSHGLVYTQLLMYIPVFVHPSVARGVTPVTWLVYTLQPNCLYIIMKPGVTGLCTHIAHRSQRHTEKHGICLQILNIRAT